MNIGHQMYLTHLVWDLNMMSIAMGWKIYKLNQLRTRILIASIMNTISKSTHLSYTLS